VPNGARTQTQISSTNASAARPPVQMHADLGLCCVVFFAAPSSVGFSTNTGKGPNVVVVVVRNPKHYSLEPNELTISYGC